MYSIFCTNLLSAASNSWSIRSSFSSKSSPSLILFSASKKFKIWFSFGIGLTVWSGKSVNCFKLCQYLSRHLGVLAWWKTKGFLTKTSSKSFIVGWGFWNKRQKSFPLINVLPRSFFLPCWTWIDSVSPVRPCWTMFSFAPRGRFPDVDSEQLVRPIWIWWDRKGEHTTDLEFQPT